GTRGRVLALWVRGIAAQAESLPAGAEVRLPLCGPARFPSRVVRRRRHKSPGKGGWVAPTAYVNLCDAPSSSGRVLATVAKGARLRVLDRKRGWVKVAGPDGAQSGWIYSGNKTALQ
ncbi:MAG TPA: SH3 domain-containing protein, partial [Methylocella sp.]|nr:SH3 domain-containing protein [Methylocella sp.]